MSMVCSIWSGDAVDESALVDRIQEDAGWSRSAGVVVAGYNLARGGTGWLVWSVDDGRLVQAFQTPGGDAVLAGTLLIASSPAEPIEGWNVVTGELEWRRRDLKLAEDSGGELVLGTALDAHAIALHDRDRPKAFLSAATGRDIPARTFRATPAPPVPPAFAPEVPPVHRLPWALPLRLDRNPFYSGDDSLRPLDRALAAWLAEPAPPRRSTQIASRPLVPSPAVARQLARLMAVEGLGTAAHLAVADAQTIVNHLGEVDDDVLALFAVASPYLASTWGIAPGGLAKLAPLGDHLRRLRPLGMHATSTSTETLALHPSGVAVVEHFFCKGPMPLAAWLSQAVYERAKGALGDAPAIELRIDDRAPAPASATRYVSHAKFGRGAVVTVDGDFIVVDFETVGRKRLKASFLTPA